MILFSVNSLAQMVIIPDEPPKDASRNKEILIDEHMLELAENYVYLLDQFEFLTDDYSKYFTKCDESAQNYYEAIKNFNINLKHGKYFENLKKFNIDLKEISAQLDDLEQSLDTDSKKSKFKQLFKNFAEDLNTYKEIYKSEVMAQLQEYENIEDLQLYLTNQYYHEAEQNKFELITEIKNKEKELAELQSKLSHFEINEHTANKSEIIIHIPNIPDEGYAPIAIVETLLIEIPMPNFELENIPEPPEIEDDIFDQVDIVIHSKGSQYQKSYDEYWNEKSFKDSSCTISQSTPIYLFNPTGEISVKGWNKNYVLAKSEISVTSDSEEKAEQFSNNISIQIYNKDGKLFVNTEIPRLKDTKTRIVDSHVSLKIPAKNSFICKSSQGLINISDMENDIKLKAANSEIIIDEIKGNIEILNNTGDIEIFNVTGDISAENSFGEIFLTRCNGTLNIDNSYDSIELIDCTGNGKIKNSGLISITGHNGNLSIKNNKGNTDINMHTGDLIISSTYTVTSLSDIRGNITVDNLNAPIKADNIIGMLSASNSRSLISISDFQGPLDIVNIKGKIILNVPDKLSGNATITPTESFVDISISENSNFDFMALTENGMIQTQIPMSITNENNQSKAVYSFGDGSYKFVINGKNSNINIKED